MEVPGRTATPARILMLPAFGEIEAARLLGLDELFAEEGNLVNPIAMNGSFSLCDLADLSDLEVELTIEERAISKVVPV